MSVDEGEVTANGARGRVKLFTLLPLNPAGNPAIVSRYEPGIISRANVFQPLPTCESRLRLTLTATQIKSAPALSRSGSLSVYSIDRKSTRLNSSHLGISYAVF